MKKNLLVFAMLAAMTFFWLPSESTVSAQYRGDRNSSQRRDRNYGNRGYQNTRQRRVIRYRSPRYNYGYRNYGQYRRNQVRNRRYRVVRRGQWNNGRRVYRIRRNY